MTNQRMNQLTKLTTKIWDLISSLMMKIQLMTKHQTTLRQMIILQTLHKTNQTKTKIQIQITPKIWDLISYQKRLGMLTKIKNPNPMIPIMKIILNNHKKMQMKTNQKMMCQNLWDYKNLRMKNLIPLISQKKMTIWKM